MRFMLVVAAAILTTCSSLGSVAEEAKYLAEDFEPVLALVEQQHAGDLDAQVKIAASRALLLALQIGDGATHDLAPLYAILPMVHAGLIADGKSEVDAELMVSGLKNIIRRVERALAESAGE